MGVEEAAAGVSTTLALAMAAPEGSVTCPRKEPEAVAWSAARRGELSSAIRRASRTTAAEQNEYETRILPNFHPIFHSVTRDLRYESSDACIRLCDENEDYGPPASPEGALKLQGVSTGGAAGAGRGLQNRLHAAEQRNRSAHTSCALGRKNYHRVAFVQISQRRAGRRLSIC